MNNEENNLNEVTKSSKKKTKKPSHGVTPLLVMVIKNHHARGMDLNRMAALTMLSKAKVQEVIDSL